MTVETRGENSFCRSASAGVCALYGGGGQTQDLCPTVEPHCMETDGGMKKYCCPIGMKIHKDATEHDVFCGSESAGECQLKGSTRELCPTVPQCVKVDGVEHCCPAGMRRERNRKTGDSYCHSKVGGECQLVGTERELCPTTVMQCIELGKDLGLGVGPNVEHCCPPGMQQVIVDPMRGNLKGRIDSHDIYCKSKEDGECQLKGDSARELCPTAQECIQLVGIQQCCPAGMRLSKDRRGHDIYCHSKNAGECQIRGTQDTTDRRECGAVLRLDTSKAKPTEKYAIATNGDFFHYEHGRKCLVGAKVVDFKIAPSPNTKGVVYFTAEKNNGYTLYELRKSHHAPTGGCPRVNKRVLLAEFSRFHMVRPIDQFLVERDNIKLADMKDEL